MPYKFNFDLTRASRSFFEAIAREVEERGLHRRAGESLRSLCEKLRIRELTGLEISDALTLVEDLVDVYARNLAERKEFLRTRRRALFLPHCSRKYMDSRCRARFDPAVPSYRCARCSPDCLINRATVLGEEKGYDVYVLPGGSCIPAILRRKKYEGVVGVACPMELREAGEYLKRRNMPGQAVVLAKNGCSNTSFSIESLERILAGAGEAKT
jgi:hypothetical protein